MIRYVPFEEYTAEHLRMLASSMIVPPEAMRLTCAEVIDQLHSGALQLFEFDGGIVAVGVNGRTLLVEALYMNIWKKRPLLAAMKQLAADYRCDTIKTSVFDRRLAAVILSMGGRVVMYDLSVPVTE